MAPIYSKFDMRYAMAEQPVFGTAVADAAAVIQLLCDPFYVPQNVNVRRGGGMHASRSPLAADLTADQYLAMPEVSLKMQAKQQELAFFLFGQCQSVVEVTNKKTFTEPQTQPDFSVADAGATLTLIKRDPILADSWKLKDAILKGLAFSCNAGERLSIVADVIGRGAPIAAAPSGTYTRSAETFWNFATLVRRTVDFGAGAQSLMLKGFELKLTQKVEGAGQLSGDIQNYGLTERAGTFTIKAIKDVNHASAIAALKASTQITINLGWGNATPGTDSGDLDFNVTAKLTDVTPDTDDVYGFVMTGEFVRPAVTTSPITIILNDGVPRGW